MILRRHHLLHRIRKVNHLLHEIHHLEIHLHHHLNQPDSGRSEVSLVISEDIATATVMITTLEEIQIKDREEQEEEEEEEDRHGMTCPRLMNWISSLAYLKEMGFFVDGFKVGRIGMEGRTFDSLVHYY